MESRKKRLEFDVLYQVFSSELHSFRQLIDAVEKEGDEAKKARFRKISSAEFSTAAKSRIQCAGSALDSVRLRLRSSKRLQTERESQSQAAIEVTPPNIRNFLIN